MSDCRCPKLADLSDALAGLSWIDVKCMAIHLHDAVDIVALDKIEQERLKTDERLIYCMHTWLQRDCEASWEKVVYALRKTKKNDLAKQIQSQHCASSRSRRSPAPRTLSPVEHFQHHMQRSDLPKEKSIPSRDLCSAVVAEGIVINKISEESSRLEEHFVSVVTQANISFSEREVDSPRFLNRLRITLTKLPLCKKYEHMHFLKEEKDRFKVARDISEIFDILDPYWNYFDYKLLEHLIARFGDDTLKLTMREYVSDLEQFEKETSIQDYLDATSSSRDIPPELHTVLIKMDRKATECTLYDIRQFKESLANKSSLSAYTLYLKKVGTGSVVVTLAFPRDVLDVVIEELLEATFLDTHRIVSVNIPASSKDDDVFPGSDELQEPSLPAIFFSSHQPPYPHSQSSASASNLGIPNLFGYDGTSDYDGYGYDIGPECSHHLSQHSHHPSYENDPQFSLNVPSRIRKSSQSSDHTQHSEHSHHSGKTHTTHHSNHSNRSDMSSRSGRSDHSSHSKGSHAYLADDEGSHYSSHTHRGAGVGYDHTPQHHSQSSRPRHGSKSRSRSPKSTAVPAPAYPLHAEPLSRYSPHYRSHDVLHSDGGEVINDSEVLLAAVDCLMHQENCKIPRCPCRRVKERFRHLLPQTHSYMQKEAGNVMEESSRGEFDPADRRQQMRLSLTSRNISEEIHPHYHMTSHSHIHQSRGMRRVLQRKRSRSVDLTPIVEQPESNAIRPAIFPEAAKGRIPSRLFSPAITPSGEQFRVLSPTTPGATQSPVLLGQISLSADNLPSLCLNDCPMAYTPLYQLGNRALGSGAKSQLASIQRRWSASMADKPKNMPTLREQESASSEEGNTSETSQESSSSIQTNSTHFSAQPTKSENSVFSSYDGPGRHYNAQTNFRMQTSSHDESGYGTVSDHTNSTHSSGQSAKSEENSVFSSCDGPGRHYNAQTNSSTTSTDPDESLKRRKWFEQSGRQNELTREPAFSTGTPPLSTLDSLNESGYGTVSDHTNTETGSLRSRHPPCDLPISPNISAKTKAQSMSREAANLLMPSNAPIRRIVSTSSHRSHTSHHSAASHTSVASDGSVVTETLC